MKFPFNHNDDKGEDREAKIMSFLFGVVLFYLLIKLVVIWGPWMVGELIRWFTHGV